MSTPTTHDFSCHDRLSVRVRSFLLLPFSYRPNESYSPFETSSDCMTTAFGYSSNHFFSVSCVHSTSGKDSPFSGPAIASPLTCRHHVLVVSSSNIALK